MFPDGRRVLCLITDRRRLAVAIGIETANSEPALLDQIAGAVVGGVDVVQIRERDLDGGALIELTRKCVALTAGSSALVVVNDRLDVVIAAGAAGVHLREDSVSVESADRLFAGTKVIGRSVHGADGARAATRASYLIAGTVFATESKPAQERLGLDGLQKVVQHSGGCPVWAVGGITIERIPLILRAGASGMAAIGAFIPRRSRRDVAAAVANLTSELRFSFDSSAAHP